MKRIATLAALLTLTACSTHLPAPPLTEGPPSTGQAMMRDEQGAAVLDPLGACDEWEARQREGARPVGCAAMEMP